MRKPIILAPAASWLLRLSLELPRTFRVSVATVNEQVEYLPTIPGRPECAHIHLICFSDYAVKMKPHKYLFFKFGERGDFLVCSF